MNTEKIDEIIYSKINESNLKKGRSFRKEDIFYKICSQVSNVKIKEIINRNIGFNTKIGPVDFKLIVKNSKYPAKIILLKNLKKISCGKIAINGIEYNFKTKNFLILFCRKKYQAFFIEEILDKILMELKKYSY